MNSPIIQTILRARGITYAVTDAELRIVEYFSPLLDDAGSSTFIGESLFIVAPELVGARETLDALLNGEMEYWELPLVTRTTRDNETRYFNLTLYPPRAECGTRGLVFIAQDVTALGAQHQTLTQQRNEMALLRQELAHQNRALQISNANLQQLDELKSAFISLAAHELRTPLTPLRAYLEMFDDEELGTLSAQQHQLVQTMRASVARLIHLSENLLDLTRLEAGRLELFLQPVGLNALLESLAREFLPMLTDKEQTYAAEIHSDLPLVLCDPLRISQVLSNLLSNASKYTPPRGQITVVAEPTYEQGYLQIAVRDDGIGIAPTEQPLIFQNFFRARNATALGAQGTGLGLHLSRALVELHGGAMWFESALGQGSTFYFTLPLLDHARIESSHVLSLHASPA